MGVVYRCQHGDCQNAASCNVFVSCPTYPNHGWTVWYCTEHDPAGRRPDGTSVRQVKSG